MKGKDNLCGRDTDLISIIVPVYNIKEYLPRCVDSILAQTYQNLEIILVDDGSVDGSGAICDEYAGQDARVKVIHKENGGQSEARNAGFQIAVGQYLGYVDGDDYIQPEMYEAMLNALLKEEAQIAVCGYRQIGEGAKEWQGTGETVVFSREETLTAYLCGHRQYRIYPAVWSKLFVREIVRDIRFAMGKTSEDIMYTTEAFCQADRCVYLDNAYYHYLVDRKDSTMNKKVAERRFVDEIPAWREQMEYLKNKGYEVLAEKAAYSFYRRMLFYYIEFRISSEKDFARRLARMLKAERAEIKVIYRNSWVAGGDRARMWLMLAWPGLYYRAVTLYDRFLIPLRQSGSDSRKR